MSGEEALELQYKSKIEKFFSSLGSKINPSILTFKLQNFLFEILQFSIEKSNHELVIFESLLGYLKYRLMG